MPRDSRELRLTPDHIVRVHRVVPDAGPAPGVEQLTLVVEKRRLEGNQEVLEYLPLLRVPMSKAAAADATERWTARHRFDDVAVHGYWFEARIGGQLYALQNNGDAVFWTREKGSGGRAAVADRPANAGPVRRLASSRS